MSTGAGSPCGVAIVDKAAAMTSHDVVARARRRLGERRIGHAGTLDPDATGVLVLGVGRATRLLRYLSGVEKTYRAEVVLGTSTTTQDSSGEVVDRFDMAGVTVDQARAAAVALTGEIDQVPPMVSAVQIGGRRLHTLARAGIEVDRPARRVTVRRFEVGPGPERGVLRIEVDCSAGTYVRTLAADLGTLLGGGAHLRALRRTRAGSFTEADARPLEELSTSTLLDPARALGHLERLAVDEEVAVRVGHGRPLVRPEVGTHGGGPWAVVDGAGELLAVYEADEHGRAAAAVVLAAH